MSYKKRKHIFDKELKKAGRNSISQEGIPEPSAGEAP